MALHEAKPHQQPNMKGAQFVLTLDGGFSTSISNPKKFIAAFRENIKTNDAKS